MSRFRPLDRHTDYLLLPSVHDWLPESHLARYVVDVVAGLDLSEPIYTLCLAQIRQADRTRSWAHRERTMKSKGTRKLDKIVVDVRGNADARSEGYRERAWKIYP